MIATTEAILCLKLIHVFIDVQANVKGQRQNSYRMHATSTQPPLPPFISMRM
jgi:hypothetical protein